MCQWEVLEHKTRRGVLEHLLKRCHQITLTIHVNLVGHLRQKRNRDMKRCSSEKLRINSISLLTASRFLRSCSRILCLSRSLSALVEAPPIGGAEDAGLGAD